jgi:ribosomal protein S18 acetylase RimI-like enzyme
MIQLLPMTEADFGMYREHAIGDHSEGSKVGSWRTAEEALQRFEAAFPSGIDTSGIRFLAIWSDRRVGFLIAQSIDRGGTRECFILDIFIDPTARRAGHARRALDQLRKLTTAEGFDRIGLSVFPENKAAIALYGAAGYSIGFIRYQLPLKS